jgi:hypothetical protein
MKVGTTSSAGAGKGAMNPHTQDHARVEHERKSFQRALEDYLAALDQASSSALPDKKRTLLAAYAEFRYQVQGGTHCTICRTPVRHTMTVEVRRPSGITAHFAALCTRCLEGEKAQAVSVTLRVGPVEFETVVTHDEQRPPARRNAVA